MPGKYTAVFTFFLVFALFSPFANGYSTTIFGPQDLTVSRWHSHLSRHKFELQSGGDGVVEVSKNTPLQEISGGFIFFNYQFIGLRNFLNGDELKFEKEIQLKSTNSLFIFVRGTPGASITLTIRRKDILAPEILSFSAAPPLIKIGQSSTLTWQTQNAETCEITPDIGSVDSAGSASVEPMVPTTYTLTAANGEQTVRATVTIAIENSAPTALTQELTTAEDTAVSIVLAGSDPDNDPLTFEIYSQPLYGTLSGDGPNLSYTPNENFDQTDSFEFIVNDGQVDSEPALVAITVTSVNDTPIAEAQTVNLNEDESLSVLLSAADVDGNNLTYEITSQPAHGMLDGDPPNVTYTPTPNYNGTDTLEFRVNDGTVDSQPAIVTFVVAPMNDAPTAADDTAFADEDTPVEINVLANDTDVDGDGLSIFDFTQPSQGMVEASDDGTLTYIPLLNFHGSDSFSYTVDDGNGGFDTGLVTVTITSINDAPIASPQSRELVEDEPTDIVLTAVDVDNDPLTYEISVEPSHGTLSGDAPNFTYTPVQNYHGPDSFVFTAGDGLLTSSPATVSLFIIGVNDIPIADAGTDQTVFRLDTVVLNGTGSFDVDDDTLSFQWSIKSAPVGSTAVLSDPSQAAPSFFADLSGVYVIELAVNDGKVDSVPDTVTITTTPRRVTVPHVISMDQTSAESSILAADLVVGTITTEYSEEQPSDHIISQNPPGGDTIEEGTAVDLVISLGSQPAPPTVDFTVNPDIIGVGENATLSWNSTNTNFAKIDNGLGVVPVNGSVLISPTNTKTYTITVSGPGGSARSHATIVVEDFFAFSQGTNALDFQTVAFIPDHTVNYYRACRTFTEVFPTDPANGTMISLGDDDFELVTLTDESQVSLYGVSYSSFYVGSNGYITFTGGDEDYTETFADHFGMPRISALFTDLRPSSATTISWLQLEDRAVVTYQDIPEYGRSDANSFQIEMFFNGVIRITYLNIAAEVGIGGLSKGVGTPEGFYESDLSLYESCILACDGDFDEDGDVDDKDRLVLEAELGRTGCLMENSCEADLDGDGKVDEFDLDIFEANFGRTDCPLAVPYLVGMDQAAAEAEIVSAGLALGPITTAHHDTVPAGQVMSQSPGAGALVPLGSVVSLVVSLGPIPPSAAITADPGRIQEGESTTLTWISQHATSATITPGIGDVDPNGSITVSPTATTTYTITVFGPGGTATVSVTVSYALAVPGLMGMEQAAAEATILSAGLALGPITTAYHDTVPAGQVMSQSPEAGALVPIASVVSLVLSLGPTPPSVTITADPENVPEGVSTTLTWASQHATSATITPGIGDVDPNGSITVSPTATTIYTITVAGPGGTATSAVTVTYVMRPVVQISSPVDGAVVRTRTTTVSGTVNDNTAMVTVNGIPVTVDNGNFIVQNIPLVSGTNSLTAIATNFAGTATVTVTVTCEILPPIIHITAPPDWTMVDSESVTVTGTVAQPDADVWVNGQEAIVTDGEFLAEAVPLKPGANRIYVTASNGLETRTAAIWVVSNYKYQPQPEGSFGAGYEDLVPADASVASYDARRFAVITGIVHDVESLPIPNVTVSILDHFEYGNAITDDEGRFSLPVEGGETLTLVYRKQGLITAQRKVLVPLNDTVVAETIQMLAPDPIATTVTFDGNPNTVITHRSTQVVDSFGSRSCTAVFTGNNRAYEVNAQGELVRELETITTRATEFITANSMPAKLPPNSAFTYCVELGVDGAEGVRFQKPVVVWVDNFLGFPAGAIVPVGYYDRDRGVWVPSDNGVVVRLLDTNGDGIVDAVDATGSGQPTDLNNNGSFSDEVSGLNDPSEYPPGSSYWRVAVTHFTPWDCNWPFGPPPGAIAPNPTGQPFADQQTDETQSCTTSSGSFVEDRSRILHEDISIPGTDMTLHYASNRVKGYKYTISVPASGATIPANLEKIIVKIDIAGRTLEQTLEPLPNQAAQFIWDGLDQWGRQVTGSTTAHVRVGFVYRLVYYLARDELSRAFGQAGSNITGIRGRQDMTSWRQNDVVVHSNGGKGVIGDGWTLSLHHSLNAADPSILYKGDGTTAKNSFSRIITTVVGRLSEPNGLALDADGNLYIAEVYGHRVRKVDPSGIITSVAGNGSQGYSGDGGPAAAAQLREPHGVALDAAGNLYIADSSNNRVRKVDPNGIITTVAGNGSRGYSGDGGPAATAQLNYPADVALDAAGNLYIADDHNYRIRKVDPNGIITTVAGSENSGYSGDNGPATAARLTSPRGIALDPAGNLYIADMWDSCIRKVDLSGIITTVAGVGDRWADCAGDSGDGGPATEADLCEPFDVALDAAGNLYIADYSIPRIRRVDPSGTIITVAGRINKAGEPYAGYSGDGGPPTAAQLEGSSRVELDASGNLYIATGSRVRKLKFPSAFSVYTTSGDITFADENGLGYIMSGAGRHKKTIDLDTGVLLYSFGYNEDNSLVSIIDRFGNETVIERNPDGVPAAIISPDGIRTWLTVDSNNHLTGITYPDGGIYSFVYTPEGLMTAKIEPEQNRFEHTFDSFGRATNTLDDEGGEWNFSRIELMNGDNRSEVRSGEGNVTSYLDHTDSTGAYTSTITDPTGAETLFSQSTIDLIANKSLPCGMNLEFAYDLDPQYKFKYLKELKESTPSGLERITLSSKTYEDMDSDDIPDFITATMTINGQTTTLEHNTLQTHKIVTSPEGRTVTSLYNPNTLLTESVSVPGLYDTIYGYDVRGRMISVTTHTRQSTFAYNTEGYLDSVTDPENYTTSYNYDPVGRITEISRPDGGSVGFSYDKNGNMTVLINPVDIDHGFGYNNVNRISSYQTPISGSYSYVYDKDRRLIQTNFPSGKTIINDYTDPANPADKSKLRQIRSPEGNIDYAYLCGTKVGSITYNGESITYGYDGKLFTSETLSGTLNQSLAYTYNLDFDVSSFTYAGQTGNYSYDNDGLLTAVGDFTISRNAGNGLPEAVSGGAISIARTFNGYGEVEEQNSTIGGQNTISWALTRDNNGSIIAKMETVSGVTASFSYTYDSMGRLLTVTKDGNLVEEYSYDISGTRISETNTFRGLAGRTFSYSDEDHLLTAGTVAYSYDLDGFLTTKADGIDVLGFTYSSRGELLSVNLPDGRIIEYLYDPLGRRIAKKVDSVIVEKYLWQGLTRLLAVYDGSDNILMRFEYADIRVPIAMTKEGVTYYLAYDQVGSLRVVADTSGNVVKRIDYDSFGNIIADSNEGFIVPFGFAGGLHDRDTGLVRFAYRDYDPDIGRWTAKDPMLFGGGDTDLYGYVLNDPINFIDPKGLAGFALDAGGGYGTGWGDSSNSDGGSAGTGIFIGVRPNSGGHAQLGGYVYQSYPDGVPGARLGLGFNATYYYGDSRNFFKGDMKYTMLTLFVGSLTKYTDPCTGETTGWTLSLGGRGFGLTGFETGISRSWSGALQE